MKIDKILEFAKKYHYDQFRKDGVTPYINHPLDICKKLYELKLTKKELSEELDAVDFNKYAIALMHDLLEDTNASIKEIEEISNKEVVDSVVTLTFKDNHDNPFGKSKYIMDIANNGNENVFEIKCIDRICNTFDFIASGDIRYAKIYFHKADILWAILYDKKEKYEKLWNAVIELNKEFKKGKRNEN